MKLALGPLVIYDNLLESTTLDFNDVRFAKAITVFSPSALSGTVVVQLSPSRDGDDWYTLQSAGVDVEIPAGKATVLTSIPSGRLRLLSDAMEVQRRDFHLVIDEKEMGRL